jgi:hypothetical protein
MKPRLLLALLLLPLLAQADALSAIGYGSAGLLLLQVVGGGLCLTALGVFVWRRYVAHQRDREWRGTWNDAPNEVTTPQRDREWRGARNDAPNEVATREQTGSHLLRYVVLGALAVTVVVYSVLLWAE